MRIKKMVVVIVFALIFPNIVYCTYDNKTTTLKEVSKMENILDINARAAILYDRETKKILFEKNMNKKMPNASTTKILTAIVAYENGNVRDMVTVSKFAANTAGSSIKLKENDKITMNDLICGMLLCSGNDAAVAIAEHISGSVEEFCKLMNEKANEIGAVNTHFTSPHGLDNDNHYSTAYDLAIISDYALNIPYIKDIVKNKKMVIKINNYVRDIYSTNEMLSYYNGSDGIKTGYTGNAGRCLVTSATKGDWQLISVVLGCDTKNKRTTDSKKLLDYGFNNFELVDVCENLKKEVYIKVLKSVGSEYKVVLKHKYIIALKKGEKEDINYKYIINDNLTAPIKAGDEIGEIIINLGEVSINSFKIIASEKINRKSAFEYIYELFIELIKMPI